jgi:hypothetical protein
MPKRPFIKVCDKDYCDYIPCVEERIVQLGDQGLDSGEMRLWLAELRAQDGRMVDAEIAWLEALDAKAAIV